MSIKLDSQVIKLHGLGNSAKEIAELLNCGVKNIWRIASKYRLKFEGSGGKNRIVNINPFTDSEESWYWIGYICADGNLSSKKYNISIVSKDVEHLLKYKKFINADITEYYRKTGELILTFGNKEIYKYLLSLNITPKIS